MTAPAGTRTEAPPEPGDDQRRVDIHIDELGPLTLGELGELGELTGIPLDELTLRLRPPKPRKPAVQDVIRVALALAVVIERRTDPSVGLADARRWDIRVVTGQPDPTRRVRGTRRSSSRA